jgi:hypothetical protein
VGGAPIASRASGASLRTGHRPGVVRRGTCQPGSVNARIVAQDCAVSAAAEERDVSGLRVEGGGAVHVVRFVHTAIVQPTLVEQISRTATDVCSKAAPQQRDSSPPRWRWACWPGRASQLVNTSDLCGDCGSAHGLGRGDARDPAVTCALASVPSTGNDRWVCCVRTCGEAACGGRQMEGCGRGSGGAVMLVGMDMNRAPRCQYHAATLEGGRQVKRVGLQQSAVAGSTVQDGAPQLHRGSRLYKSGRLVIVLVRAVDFVPRCTGV